MAERPAARPGQRGEREARPPHADDRRIAPDPLTAVLPALAALGAIASVAAVNWAGREASPGRPRSRRKAGAALRDLEASCLGLQSIFGRLATAFAEPARDGPSPALALKFGVHGRAIPHAAFAAHQQLINDIASTLVVVSQNAFDVTSSIEDGEIEAPETVFFGFGEQQEKLNQLLAQRPSLERSIAQGREIAAALAALVRELRKHETG
jgi:hypothetical protein